MPAEKAHSKDPPAGKDALDGPWTPLGAPTKYLGKLYIDRRTGERPSRAMILRALAIIEDQAPRKDKQVVLFKSSEDLNPPCLIGEAPGGSLLIRVPILKVFSVGCSKRAFYYLTSLPTEQEPGVTRFWLFAFQSKSKQHANLLSTNLISICSVVRELRKDMLRTAAGGSTPATPASKGDLSFHEGSPHNSIISASSSSAASSTDNSPVQARGSSSMYDRNIEQLVKGVELLNSRLAERRGSMQTLPKLPGTPDNALSDSEVTREDLAFDESHTSLSGNSHLHGRRESAAKARLVYGNTFTTTAV